MLEEALGMYTQTLGVEHADLASLHLGQEWCRELRRRGQGGGAEELSGGAMISLKHGISGVAAPFATEKIR